MSETHQVWLVMWEFARVNNNGLEPFELDDILPTVCELLKSTPEDARRHASLLLKELERVPEGKQYFSLEGNAVVPLEEFYSAPKDTDTAYQAYPFEI